MSLRDQSCYTLILQPSSSDPNIVELVEVVGVKREPRYARVKDVRVDLGETQSASIYDYLTGAKLASTGFAGEKGSKQRRLQLHGPDEEVPFEASRGFGFEWVFTFNGCKFRWNREIVGKDYICSLDRKPDPKVEICLARSPDSKDPGRIQILHYNLERFPNEITDMRGLETLLVTTFMSFVDAYEDRSTRPTPSPAAGSKISPSNSGSAIPTIAKQQAKIISEDDFEPESSNEIRVGQRSDLDERTSRAIGLLMDPSVLFVIIRTNDPGSAQRALQVALGVTRFRHREGLGDLHQYVVEQTEPDLPSPKVPATGKGPKVIKLDNPIPQSSPPKQSKTPTTALNISIYLSTIQLPDLAPKARKPSAGTLSKPAKSDNPRPAQATSSGLGASKPSKFTSAPASAPTLPPKVVNKPPPPSRIADTVRPPPPSASNVRPTVPAAPPPLAPPRPPPPVDAQGGQGGKNESVMKKLIAMSRR